MAAHSAVIRIESLAFLPGFGFGIACSALVGQYLGAKRPEDAILAELFEIQRLARLHHFSGSFLPDRNAQRLRRAAFVAKVLPCLAAII